MAKYHVYVPEIHYVRYIVEASAPPEARLVVYTLMEEGEGVDEGYGSVYNRTLEDGWHIEKVSSGPGLKDANRESDQGSDGGKEADPSGTGSD